MKNKHSPLSSSKGKKSESRSRSRSKSSKKSKNSSISKSNSDHSHKLKSIPKTQEQQLTERKEKRARIKCLSIWEFESDESDIEKEKPLLAEFRKNEMPEIKAYEEAEAKNMQIEMEEQTLKKKEQSEKQKRKKNKKRKKSSSSSSSDNEEEIKAIQQEPMKTEDIILQAINKEVVGPIPLQIDTIVPTHKNTYGGSLLPGEASAMAQYIQSGKRIPRRGEVGLTSEAIESQEKLGQVMSGSRHKRMTAVRMRKEQQVYNAEEKRALQLQKFDQKLKDENKKISYFQKLLNTKIQ